MNPRLIGLTGPAGCGKSTVGAILKRRHGFCTYGFADPIRDAVDAILDGDAHWEDRVWKETPLPRLGVSPRRLAQTLGTEWGRHLHGEDFWLKIAEYWLAGAKEDFVITDVRFENEAAWIRAQGGRIWHIERPGISAVEAHSSENGIDFAIGDLRLFNHGSLDDLAERVSGFLDVMEALERGEAA